MLALAGGNHTVSLPDAAPGDKPGDHPPVPAAARTDR